MEGMEDVLGVREKDHEATHLLLGFPSGRGGKPQLEPV